MEKIKLIGADSGKEYSVEKHRASFDPVSKLHYIKTANEFAFEVVEEVKKEVEPKKATPKAKPKTTPKAKPQEVKTEKEAE